MGKEYAISITNVFQLIKVMRENFLFSLNGRATSMKALVKNKKAHVLSSSNHWSVTENNSNNSWNVNFNNGYTNNNNKNNSNVGRAISALGEEEIISWIEASDDCCRNKKTSYQCTMYRVMMEALLLPLALSVKNRTYTPSASECFVVKFPKLREIFAANFLDRIVQHWITLRIEPLLEDLFIQTGDVSFNCRKGYGTLRAVQTFAKQASEVTERWTKGAWIGRFDLKSFFMSIDKERLWCMLKDFIQDRYNGDDKETLLWLSEITVKHRPQDNCIRKGDISLWNELPTHKSLFTMDGMAIGNITSQILANFYLNKIDDFAFKYCQEHNGWYERFVDDIIVVLPIKQDVKNFRTAIKDLLEKTLGLTLHEDKVYIQHVTKGVKFVGSVVMPNRVYLANRTVGRLYDTLAKMERFCADINLNNPTINNLRVLEHYVCACNSYMGFLKYNNSYALRRKLFGRLEYFWKVVYVSRHFDKIVIRKRFRLDEKLLTLHNCKTKTHKTYGNKIFKRTSNNGTKRSKTNSKLQCERVGRNRD